MKKLDIEIPPFKLKRYMSIHFCEQSGMVITGKDNNGSPYDIFKRTRSCSNNEFDLEFYGNYGEPMVKC